jgi:hypothetical protein
MLAANWMRDSSSVSMSRHPRTMSREAKPLRHAPIMGKATRPWASIASVAPA